MKSFIIFTLLVLNFSAFSANLDGINFEDKIKLENKDLVLNGIGIRKATFLKVKVYYGALYMEAKSSDLAAIQKLTPKQITMTFVRDVEAEKLVDGFKDGFDDANGKNAAALKLPFEKFLNTLKDIKKEQKIVVQFLLDGVQVNFNGTLSEKIGNADFSKALFNVWFINVRDEGLRDGLLGK